MSGASIQPIIDGLDREIGGHGRWRLSVGETATGSIYAVKAISADFAYDAGCAARLGDAPTDGDVVAQHDTDYWPARVVVNKAGSAWVYADSTPTIA